MTKNYNHQQIKKIIQVLKEPEKRASEYLIENLENKDLYDLYNELRLYKEALLVIEQKAKPNVDYHWKNLEKKITPQNKRFSFLKIAAAVLILVSVSFFLRNEIGLVKESYDERANAISIGSPKAILIISDGTRIHLSDAKSTIINTKNTNVIISKEKSTLQYKTKNNIVGKGKVELEYHTIEVPKFGEWKLILPDGSKVWLNAESIFKYPVDFVGNNRKVYLSGEAYFEVASDKNKPFIVNTEKIDTKVLGTEFNISAYPEENLNITLAKGSVSLYNKLSNSNITLQPNDNAELKVNEANINLTKVDIKKYIAWKNGYYYFDREKLSNILKKLQKWYDFQVFYENPMTKYYEFRMRADRNLGFGQIIKRLEETGRVKIKIVENSIVISDVKRN
jgi:hypothetical protein